MLKLIRNIEEAKEFDQYDCIYLKKLYTDKNKIVKYVGMSSYTSNRIYEQFKNTNIGGEEAEYRKNNKIIKNELYIVAIVPCVKYMGYDILKLCENYFITKENSHKEGLNSNNISYEITDDEFRLFDIFLNLICEATIDSKCYDTLKERFFMNIEDKHLNLYEVIKNPDIKEKITCVKNLLIHKETLSYIGKEIKSNENSNKECKSDESLELDVNKYITLIKNELNKKYERTKILDQIEGYLNNVSEFKINLSPINERHENKIYIERDYIVVPVKCKLELYNSYLSNVENKNNEKNLKIKLYYD